MTNFLIFLDTFMWNALIIIGSIFILLGIDRILFDLYFYWNLIFPNKIAKQKIKCFSQIPSLPEKRIAIMVACWREYGVINKMIQHNLQNIQYKNYDFFIGAHPNDIKTVNVIQSLAKTHPQVYCALAQHSGPTGKGDNLNQIYRFIGEQEKISGNRYDIFLIHDSEDVINPHGLTLCNYGIAKGYDMVQIPIFPVKVSQRSFTHWIYNDEFAQQHTQDLLAREWANGFIPSAGVGTAYSRAAFEKLARCYDNKPFNTYSLTEDYDIALRLHLLDAKATLLLLKDDQNRYLATYSLFPEKYFQAIRQRSRWTLGIVLQQWWHGGWTAKWKTNYHLFHDRQAIVSNFICGFSYIVAAYWLLQWLISVSLGTPNTFSIRLETHPYVWAVIIGATFVMLWRLLQRVIATTRVYGLFPGLCSVLRAPHSNFLNLHASYIALAAFIKERIGKKATVWAKTQNRFPNFES